ncbi:MAG TPA: ABC transporter substrate-binding protein [Halococcus sp.]|nr:ABC transporter substrate-binding protein [Halococcus sp.]
MRRRRFLTGVTALGALLSGCTSSGDGGSGTDTADGGSSSNTASASTATDTGSYSVSIAPMGEVTFEEVPKKWLANNGSWADMGVALGHDLPKGVWLTDRYITRYYEAIPGVSVDKSGMIDLYSDGVSKEVFYETAADVHVMDPNFILNRFKGLERADIEGIRKNVAPFFGNSIFSRGYPWHDYRYYSLYEAFGKLAAVFQQRERYQAFSNLHEDFQQTIEKSLPDERPSVAILWASGNEPETFLPYLIDKGTSYKQWRDLKVRDALAETDVKGFHSSRGQIDYETLLAIDPDVLLLRGHEQQTKKEFQNTVVKFMKNHPVASELSAVKHRRVFRGGPLYQGPITNLVLTERAANQLYPDAFSDVQLYDPQWVSAIVNGDFRQ